jgi:hypothetical protein
MSDIGTKIIVSNEKKPTAPVPSVIGLTYVTALVGGCNQTTATMNNVSPLTQSLCIRELGPNNFFGYGSMFSDMIGNFYIPGATVEVPLTKIAGGSTFTEAISIVLGYVNEIGPFQNPFIPGVGVSPIGNIIDSGFGVQVGMSHHTGALYLSYTNPQGSYVTDINNGNFITFIEYDDQGEAGLFWYWSGDDLTVEATQTSIKVYINNLVVFDVAADLSASFPINNVLFGNSATFIGITQITCANKIFADPGSVSSLEYDLIIDNYESFYTKNATNVCYLTDELPGSTTCDNIAEGGGGEG